MFSGWRVGQLPDNIVEERAASIYSSLTSGNNKVKRHGKMTALIFLYLPRVNVCAAAGSSEMMQGVGLLAAAQCVGWRLSHQSLLHSSAMMLVIIYFTHSTNWWYFSSKWRLTKKKRQLFFLSKDLLLGRSSSAIDESNGWLLFPCVHNGPLSQGKQRLVNKHWP